MKLHPDVKDKRAKEKFKTLKQDFIAVHGHSFNYDLVMYKNIGTKVTMRCTRHGVFSIKPADHLKGQGCKECKAQKLRLTFKGALLRFREVHGDKYRYLRLVRVEGKSYVDFYCPKHGAKRQLLQEHLRGAQCVGCSKVNGGFRRDKPGLLYYIKIEVKGLIGYKVGITNNTVEERYKTEKPGTKITTIAQKQFEKGSDCLNTETEILQNNTSHKLPKGVRLLRSGHTETYKHDIYPQIKHHFGA